MSIDKKKWRDIAEKYDTKAKWADALLMLNTDDHDDIISALIELDPKELFAIIDQELGRERPAK